MTNDTYPYPNTPLILAVDDDPSTRKILRREMEREGYQVCEANDGKAALEMLATQTPDAILVDALMPEMDGFAFCETLHARGNSVPPVLMITSLDSEASAERAFAVGATDYITKPIRPVVLRHRVRRLLKEKAAALQLRSTLKRERELSELRSRIIDIVSHEFRTPLSVVLFSNSLLERYGSTWPENKCKIHYNRINAAIEQMEALLVDIALVGEADAGKLNFRPTRLDLVRCCCTIVERMQRMDDRGADIQWSSDRDRLEAVADEKLLRYIVTNLLSNAMKYSPQGSPIQVSLDCRDDRAIVAVRDRGIGIPMEDRSRLFEAFHRGSNAGALPGIGLGLAIAKRSMDLHGGEIAIESEVGSGTTFTAVFPLNLTVGDRATEDRRSPLKTA